MRGIVQIIVDNNSGITEDLRVARHQQPGGQQDAGITVQGRCAAEVQSAHDAHTSTLSAIPEPTREVLEQIAKQIESRGKREPIRLRASFSVMGWRLRGDGRSSWQGQGASYRTIPKSAQLIDVRTVAAAATVIACWVELTWLLGRVGPVVVREWLGKLRAEIEGIGVK